MDQEDGKLHFGYKRHMVTDENGLVLAEETTAANESDIKYLETPLKKAGFPQGTPVYADKGYDSVENMKKLGKMKLKSRIMYKGARGKKITERQQRINVAISKIRYRFAPSVPYSGGFLEGWQDMWDWQTRMRSTRWRP